MTWPNNRKLQASNIMTPTASRTADRTAFGTCRHCVREQNANDQNDDGGNDAGKTRAAADAIGQHRQVRRHRAGDRRNQRRNAIAAALCGQIASGCTSWSASDCATRSDIKDFEAGDQGEYQRNKENAPARRP